MDDKELNEQNKEKLDPLEHIRFRTNYDVCLFNFVDKLTLWSPFVSPEVRKHFTDNYGLTDEDLKTVEQYQKARRSLSWEETAELLNWAYEGFAENDRYQQLISAIKYFEGRKNAEGKTLGEEVESAMSVVKQRESEVRIELAKHNALPVLAQAEPLFNRVGAHDREVTCYLFFAPTYSVQGGANGDAITVEVPLGDKDPVKRIVRTIVHEDAHWVLRPGNFLKGKMGDEPGRFYQQLIKDLYDDKLGDFFEEAIVYAVANGVIFKENLQERIDYIEGVKARGEYVHGIRYVNLWRAALKMQPVMEDYFSGRTNVEETRQRIFQTSKDFIDRYLSQEKS